MTLLLEIKETLKQIYAKYGTFILPVLKFILALVCFKNINSSLNFVEELNSVFVLLILSLICSVMPLNLTVIFGIVLLIGQCYGIGIEIAGFAAALILILVILYIRFTPQDAIVLLLTPLAFKMGVPCIIPIGYGLTRTPASAISSGCGVVVYYFMRLVGQNTAVFQGTDKEKIVENLKFLLDGLLKNQDMMMNIIAFVAVLLIVNIIRRLPVDYAWQIAIFTGAISYVVIMVAGGLFGDVGSQMFPLIAGTIGSVILAVIMEFFLFHVDYTRIEYLEYEDDDYCYYVKAVPKMSIAGKEVKVTTFQETEQEMPIHMTEVPMTEVQPMDVPPLEEPVVQNVDYESQLEESLRNL